MQIVMKFLIKSYHSYYDFVRHKRLKSTSKPLDNTLEILLIVFTWTNVRKNLFQSPSSQSQKKKNGDQIKNALPEKKRPFMHCWTCAA